MTTICRFLFLAVTSVATASSVLAAEQLVPADVTISDWPGKTDGERDLYLRSALAAERIREDLIAFQLTFGADIRVERVLYPIRDGGLDAGYVFTPVALKAGPRHPGLVFVHGSTHGSFESLYSKTIAAAVAHGYIVIFPEVRGSVGYGVDYYLALDSAGGCVDDVLSATDFLVESQPQVDPRRLAIMGFSHGGLITLLAIEKDRARFKAAVDICGVANLADYAAARPANEIYAEPCFRGAKSDPAFFVRLSPISHAAEVQCPLLVFTAGNDMRLLAAQHSDLLVKALRESDKTCEYQRYPEVPGGHYFFFSDSAIAKDAMKRTFVFLDKYLKGTAESSH